MFKKLIKHLSIAFVFLILTLGQQYIFYYLKGIPIIWLPIHKYFTFFLFFLGSTLIKPQKLSFFFLTLIFNLNFFQMAHLSYFGTQILPSEIYLLFTQLGEVQGTLFVEFHHIIIPMVFTLCPLAIGYYLFKKNKNLVGSKILGIFFILYFIYNPVRTFVTGNTWGRQPSTRELSGMNVYLSFSYFLGKVLPSKLTQGPLNKVNNSSTELSFSDTKSDWDKIILILGESLSPHHMSLYGYKRETTPFLLSQKTNKNFFHTIGISGGVSTDVSVAFLLNLGFGEAGVLKASKGSHCLFKLAKEKNYSTHFLSIQSSQQLRYIAPYLCSSALDEYKTLEDISPETTNHEAASDQDLLKYLAQIMASDSKQFIILHQRGSHAPWEKRSEKLSQIFPHNEKINYYDNSVFEFDIFMKKFDSYISTIKKKVLTIYLSDHGESLGVDGVWGHGQLVRTSFEVPVIFKAYNKNLPPETSKLPPIIPHYNVALYLALALGHKPNQEINTPPKDYVIYGNDIDGYAGKADISFNADGTYNFNVRN